MRARRVHFCRSNVQGLKFRFLQNAVQTSHSKGGVSGHLFPKVNQPLESVRNG